MPRGRQDPIVKQERENFMLALFRKNPDLSVPKANAEHKARFREMMRNKRVYELRDAVRAEAKAQAGAPVPERDRNPASVSLSEVQRSAETARKAPKVFLIEGDRAKLETAREIITALAEAGVPVAVDHITDAYMIVKS